jgi:predicted DNA-binding transcriptional regulator AlpA
MLGRRAIKESGVIMERYLSARQIMDVLSVSRSKAYEIINELPYLKSPVRVSEKLLREWIEKNTVYPKRLK